MTTSDEPGCYVYIQLPGSLDVVTCGRFVQKDGIGQFVYGRNYLSNPHAVELEKSALSLRAGTFTTAKLGGIHPLPFINSTRSCAWISCWRKPSASSRGRFVGRQVPISQRPLEQRGGRGRHVEACS